MTPQVGFVGLGIMGKPMARNLHRAGFSVMVWRRSIQAMAALRWSAVGEEQER